MLNDFKKKYLIQLYDEKFLHKIYGCIDFINARNYQDSSEEWYKGWFIGSKDVVAVQYRYRIGKSHDFYVNTIDSWHSILLSHVVCHHRDICFHEGTPDIKLPGFILDQKGAISQFDVLCNLFTKNLSELPQIEELRYLPSTPAVRLSEKTNFYIGLLLPCTIMNDNDEFDCLLEIVEILEGNIYRCHLQIPYISQDEQLNNYSLKCYGKYWNKIDFQLIEKIIGRIIKQV